MDTTTWTKNEVGRRLAYWFRTRNLDATAIAGRLGWRTNEVKRYIRGQTEPGAHKLMLLLDAMAVTVAEFDREPPSNGTTA